MKLPQPGCNQTPASMQIHLRLAMRARRARRGTEHLVIPTVEHPQMRAWMVPPGSRVRQALQPDRAEAQAALAAAVAVRLGIR